MRPHPKKTKLIAASLLGAFLGGCASTSDEEAETSSQSYPDQLKQQGTTMAKNIGTSAVKRGMNKVGNDFLSKLKI